MMMEQQRNAQLIRDGQEDQPEEDDRGMMMQQDNMGGQNFEGRGGALVEEAKAMLNQGEENEEDKPVENAGPKIKMNRIRKKKNAKGDDKKQDDGTGAPKKKDADLTYKAMDKPSGNVAFTE